MHLELEGLRKEQYIGAWKSGRKTPASDLCTGLLKKITWSFPAVMGK